jgi:hypothetical protein
MTLFRFIYFINKFWNGLFITIEIYLLYFLLDFYKKWDYTHISGIEFLNFGSKHILRRKFPFISDWLTNTRAEDSKVNHHYPKGSPLQERSTAY